MIDDNTTLADLSALLEGAGLRVASVRREGGRYVAVLDIEEAHAFDKVRACEGGGATLAEAIEDARLGWVNWVAHIARLEAEAEDERDGIDGVDPDVLWNERGERGEARFAVAGWDDDGGYEGYEDRDLEVAEEDPCY